MIVFEYPFNERMRTLLRLEDLFAQFSKNNNVDQPHHHHHAMLTLFQIIDVMDRGDLKIDLMQELEKQRAMLVFYRSNPNIDLAKLDSMLEKIHHAMSLLRDTPPKLVQEIKNNDWLMNIKQRAVIPGGLCEFDLPSYHYWLNLPVQTRQKDIDTWISPIMPVYQATQLVLELLRTSAETQQLTAQNGTYQQMLNTSKPAQMLCIEIADEVCCYPEVSANKYAVHIRFMHINEHRQASACQRDINFKLNLAS